MSRATLHVTRPARSQKSASAESNGACGLEQWRSRLAALLVGRPEREVVTQQLHDESGVLVRVLLDIVELRDGILESGARHFASLVWILEHLVLEDGIVECETETNWVSHCQVLLGNLVSLLVSQPRVFGRLGLGVAVTELSDVPVIVGLHLLVEDLRLASRRLTDEAVVQETKNGVADFLEFCFDFAAILFRVLGLLVVALRLFLLFDARDNAPRSTAAADRVLVGHGEQVT